MKYYLKETKEKFYILQNFLEMPEEPKHNYKPAERLYEEEIKKWNDSSKSIEISSSSLEGFKDLVQKNYLSNLGNLHPNWYEDIKRGIKIPEERVKIGTLENDSLAFLLTEVEGKWKVVNEKFAEGIKKMESGDWKPKVRPEDRVDDEQEKLICDLIREVTGSNFVSNPRRMGLAKQKFKITRL